PTQITATVPTTAVTGSGVVTNAGGAGTAAGSFTVLPRVTGFSPSSAAALSNVTIKGTGLASPSAVKFAGEAAQVVSSTATSVVVKVPTTAGVGQIGVTTGGGSSTSALSFKPLPRFGTLPAVQAGDTKVVLPGTNLLGATSVKLGSLPLNVT